MVHNILNPTPVYAPKGYKILDANGNHICTLSRDVHRDEEVFLDQFTDWQIPEPKPGDEISPEMYIFINEGPYTND